MKRKHALAIGIGVVAGLRPMMALALVAWGLKRRWIRPARSPYGRIVYPTALRRIADCAISELIADKLPFTRSRLHAAPLALRIASGAISGAAMNESAKKRPVEGAVQGAALGGLGAFAGAIAGYSVRQRFNRRMPDFAIALFEDALAFGGGMIAVALAARLSKQFWRS